MRRLPVPTALAAALLLPSLLSPPVASAQSQSQSQSDEATELDEVVVTGTRTEVALEDSIVPAQVIDRDAIERSQASSLQELLRGRAGIDIVNQGGLGKLSTLSMRGAESDHVLVLVDGVRVGSATAGLVMFQDLPLEQIERIEIVRGPRSSLYGSEAIGGVIQVFTRRHDGAFSPRLRMGIGSNNLREASAGIGGGNARGWFGVDVAHQRTDGINACRGSGTLFQGCFADEPDDDGYRNTSVNLRGGLDLGDALVLEANALHIDMDNEFDGSSFSGNEGENVQRVVGGKLAWTPSQRTTVTLQAGSAWDQTDNYYADAVAGTRGFVSTFDTRRDTASVQADIALASAHLLSAGIDWQDDNVESTTGYIRPSRDNLAAFVAYQGRSGAHRWQASARNDDNEQFGSHTTGSVGWGFDFDNGLRLNTSIATGFRAPSFNELYYPFSGNPDLGPEESESVNIGLGRSTTRWNWTFNLYQTRVDDLIGYDSAFNLIQADEARIRGAEFTFDITLAGWDLSTQLSHLDPRNRSDGANHGNLLPRRARTSGRIDLDRAFGKFRVGTTLNGAGNRYDDAANAVRLGGYATLDLRAEYAFHANWTLSARVGNVFDRSYETIAWYHQPGREYGLSLRWQPKD